MSPASVPGRGPEGNSLLVYLLATLIGGGFCVFIATAIVAHSPAMGDGTAAEVGLMLCVGGMFTGFGFAWMWLHRDREDPPS